jgi:transcriptional regulator with XRE-family HTH domain
MNLSRSVFAGQAGLDASLLRSYECARSQLNYVAAYNVIRAFGINPEWLATGNGRLWLPIPLPSPKELNVGARALFSKIYEFHLAKSVEKATKAWKSKPPPEPLPIHVNAADPRARLVAEAQMVNWMKRLILCLPDERLKPFLNFVYLEGTKLYRTWPADTKEAFEQRRDAMDHARAAMEGTKNFLACEQSEEAGKSASSPSNIGGKIICKSTLDTLPPLAHTVGVHEIRDLKGLIERLKKVTAHRGAKSALAREFKVSRQAVNQWLSGESNPSAELAIRLQYWKPKLPEK